MLTPTGEVKVTEGAQSAKADLIASIPGATAENLHEKIIIVHSDTLRANKTTELFLQEVFPDAEKLDVIETSTVREIHWGATERMNRDSLHGKAHLDKEAGMAQDDPMSWQSVHAAVSRSSLGCVLTRTGPTGESVAEVLIRSHDFLTRMGEDDRFTGKTPVIIGHGTHQNATTFLLNPKALTFRYPHSHPAALSEYFERFAFRGKQPDGHTGITPPNAKLNKITP